MCCKKAVLQTTVFNPFIPNYSRDLVKEAVYAEKKQKRNGFATTCSGPQDLIKSYVMKRRPTLRPTVCLKFTFYQR